jgi:hypothetical protein
MNDIDLRGTETGESEFTLPDRKPQNWEGNRLQN